MKASVWGGMGGLPSGWSLCPCRLWPTRACVARPSAPALPGQRARLMAQLTGSAPLGRAVLPVREAPPSAPAQHTQLQPWEAATCHKMPSGPAVHNRFKLPGGLGQRNP